MSTYRTAHKGDRAVLFYRALRIAMPTEQRYTEAPFSLTINGQVYDHTYGLSVGELVQTPGSVQGASVTLQSTAGTLGALVSSLTGAYKYPEVELIEAWLDASAPSSTTVQGYDTIRLGRMESPTWNSTTLRFNIAPLQEGQASRVPAANRGFSSACTYATSGGYRGEECRVTVALAPLATYPTCDGSFGACTLRGNTARFGGFRHVPPDGFTIYYGLEGSFIVHGPQNTGGQTDTGWIKPSL